MSGLQVEGLFTAALGLQALWEVDKVELNKVKRRIDFGVTCSAARLGCPSCGGMEQPIHGRVRRSWRHLDFFQLEAWLHAAIPRVGCTACGKTSQAPVPWSREGSGFTMLFEALALSLRQSLLPVRQAAQMLDKTLHLIADNYATHKHPVVQAWLAKHPRFNMHFTPTPASWSNMVERFFRDITVNRAGTPLAGIIQAEAAGFAKPSRKNPTLHPLYRD